MDFLRSIIHFFMNILPLFTKIPSLLAEFWCFYGFFVRHKFNWMKKIILNLNKFVDGKLELLFIFFVDQGG